MRTVTLGERVRELRTDLALTQETAAGRCGMQPAVLGRLERDEIDPRVSSVEKVARAFGMTMAELFDGVDWSKRARYF